MVLLLQELLAEWRRKKEDLIWSEATRSLIAFGGFLHKSKKYVGGKRMEKRNIIESQIEQMLGKVAWTHKIQEKQADIYRRTGDVTEIIKIILSAITSSGILAVAFGADSTWFKILTAVVALLSTGVNLYLKKYDFITLEREHKASAVDWLGLREDYVTLIADIRAGIVSDKNLISRRDALLEKYKEVAKKSPNTTSKAYTMASDALNINLDDLISEEEINKFLPPELRREHSC